MMQLWPRRQALRVPHFLVGIIVGLHLAIQACVLQQRRGITLHLYVPRLVRGIQFFNSNDRNSVSDVPILAPRTSRGAADKPRGVEFGVSSIL